MPRTSRSATEARIAKIRTSVSWKNVSPRNMLRKVSAIDSSTNVGKNVVFRYLNIDIAIVTTVHWGGNYAFLVNVGSAIGLVPSWRKRFNKGVFIVPLPRSRSVAANHEALSRLRLGFKSRREHSLLLSCGSKRLDVLRSPDTELDELTEPIPNGTFYFI